MESKYKVALMHVSPVFLDTKKTIDKVCSLIEEASSKGARLIIFHLANVRFVEVLIVEGFWYFVFVYTLVIIAQRIEGRFSASGGLAEQR